MRRTDINIFSTYMITDIINLRNTLNGMARGPTESCWQLSGGRLVPFALI